MKTKNPVVENPSLSRRSFGKLVLGFLGAVAALEIGGISLSYLKSRSDDNKQGGLVLAGEIDNFAPGSVTPFNNDGFFLVRDEIGDFLAVHRRCPHLGCNVEWQPENNHFVCPCHASLYDSYGDYENAPIPRPLDTIEVQIQDTSVYVNTARVTAREGFDPSQMTSPKLSLMETGNE
ncbi:ubiquinol-cytochrome c reductase iron-sulfur subunit [Chloroflexota bacterium]